MTRPGLEATLENAFAWAVWKVLDYLSTKYLPGSLLDDPQRAGSAAFQAAGSLKDGGADGPVRRSPGAQDGSSAQPALPLDAALAALHQVDPQELQTALASLRNDNSPLVQCLAWSLGAPGLNTTERQRRLDVSLGHLSKAEAFALLAVLLWQQSGQ
jgi:hypothetical protein